VLKILGTLSTPGLKHNGTITAAMTLSLWSPVSGLFDFLVLLRLERSEVRFINTA
jgi:hypothetical protein